TVVLEIGGLDRSNGLRRAVRMPPVRVTRERSLVPLLARDLLRVLRGKSEVGEKLLADSLHCLRVEAGRSDGKAQHFECWIAVDRERLEAAVERVLGVLEAYPDGKLLHALLELGRVQVS